MVVWGLRKAVEDSGRLNADGTPKNGDNGEGKEKPPVYLTDSYTGATGVGRSLVKFRSRSSPPPELGLLPAQLSQVQCTVMVIASDSRPSRMHRSCFLPSLALQSNRHPQDNIGSAVYGMTDQL
jgi:hypothetical protein